MVHQVIDDNFQSLSKDEDKDAQSTSQALFHHVENDDRGSKHSSLVWTWRHEPELAAVNAGLTEAVGRAVYDLEQVEVLLSLDLFLLAFTFQDGSDSEHSEQEHVDQELVQNRGDLYESRK